MVNIRSKLKKTQNAIKTMGDYDHESGAFVASNDDLLTEILIRLPAISILRFKSVSKHWRWLLSHRNFTMRFDRLSKSPGLFYGCTYVPFDVENVGTLPFRSLDCYPDPCGIKIMQSCNGLLLCRSIQWNFDGCKYYVFNPTTKQFVVIPAIPGGHLKIRFMCLAFHQTDCVHFKVVCIRRLVPKEDGLFQILLYSSETQKWKTCVESFYSKGIFLGSGVYWKGAIYWTPFDDNPFYFKLDDEQLQLLPLPLETMSSGLMPTYFGESRGHLHLIVTNCFGNKSLHVNVYEMLSDHSGWFVKYQLDLDQLSSAFPEIIYEHGYEFTVIDVVRGEKEEDTFLVTIIRNKVITYNVHDKSFKQIFFLNYLSGGYPSLWFYRYIETIASF